MESRLPLPFNCDLLSDLGRRPLFDARRVLNERS